jgi:hypothetical protein
MSSGGPSNLFLVAGIVINVLVTGLAIWWLFRQGVRKPSPPPEREPDR